MAAKASWLTTLKDGEALKLAETVKSATDGAALGAKVGFQKEPN
jgi:hypothetical protein